MSQPKTQRRLLIVPTIILIVFASIFICFYQAVKNRYISINEWSLNSNSVRGVDISEYQADVDMNKLKDVFLNIISIIREEKVGFEYRYFPGDNVKITLNGDEVKVTHAGLAGAGVGAGMCRGMGEGVKYIELIETGGGSKVGKATVVTPKLEKIVIGIDDTDTKDAGATWTMAHNLGVELSNQGFEYLDHIIVQLYPHNPHKTQNCVSIALTFAVESDKKEELINKVIEILKRDTLSDKTAIAVLEGLTIPKKLREYSISAKTGMVDVETAEKTAKELNIDLISVTGNQGKVGALAALGLYDDVEEAVKAYDEK